MIRKDQPTIFRNTDVIAAVSSIEDGNMKFGLGADDSTFQNRRSFLGASGISIDQTTLVKVSYDADDFRRYRTVSLDEKGFGMAPGSETEYVDALVVDQPDHALFLPLADCVGAILYDPIERVLMVSHLGRHSVEMDGGRKSVEYLVEQYGVSPRNLRVWLSPAVGKATYPLNKFGGRSLHEVILGQLNSTGVAHENVEVSSADTATDDSYFSHSQHIRDASQPAGRFAIVAMMTVQGEPAV